MAESRADGDGPELVAHIRAELEAASELAARVAGDLPDAIARLAEATLETLDAGGRVLFCGNGGSAADAQHLAAEYVIRFQRDRAALPAIALTTDTSILTAGGNDFGFERIFARQVEAIGSPGDLLVLHSTSGRSPNLLVAARAARAGGLRTAALLAKGGGALEGEVDLAIVVPTDNTARAQEIHLMIGHAVADWIDRERSGAGGEDRPERGRGRG